MSLITRIVSFVVVCLSFSTISIAGLKVEYPLIVDSKQSFFYGSLSDIRNSKDENEYIGCTVDNNCAFCLAKGIDVATGDYSSTVMCSTHDPEFLSVVRAMQSNSLIYVQHRDGICEYISTSQGSALTP